MTAACSVPCFLLGILSVAIQHSSAQGTTITTPTTGWSDWACNGAGLQTRTRSYVQTVVETRVSEDTDTCPTNLCGAGRTSSAVLTTGSTGAATTAGSSTSTVSATASQAASTTVVADTTTTDSAASTTTIVADTTTLTGFRTDSPAASTTVRTTYYTLTTFTGTEDNAGTGSIVYVQLVGNLQTSRQIKLPGQKEDSFLYGKQADFVLSLPYLGALRQLSVWTDGTGEYPSWDLDQVKVYDNTTSITYTFQFNTWVDTTAVTRNAE